MIQTEQKFYTYVQFNALKRNSFLFSFRNLSFLYQIRAAIFIMCMARDQFIVTPPMREKL